MQLLSKTGKTHSSAKQKLIKHKIHLLENEIGQVKTQMKRQKTEKMCRVAVQLGKLAIMLPAGPLGVGTAGSNGRMSKTAYLQYVLTKNASDIYFLN